LLEIDNHERPRSVTSESGIGADLGLNAPSNGNWIVDGKRLSGHKAQKGQRAEGSGLDVAMGKVLELGIAQVLRSGPPLNPGEALLPGVVEPPNSRSAASGRGLTWEILQKVCPVPNADRRAHADLFRKFANSRVAVIISSTANWNNDWIKWCATQPTVTSGHVLPIFLAESRPSISDCLHSSYAENVRIFAPAPWGSQMLRAFLDETECGFLDHKILRRKILEGSGGAPGALIAACATLKERYRGGAGDVDQWLSEWAPRTRLSLTEVGLESAYNPILKDLDDASSDELEILGDLMGHAAPDLMSRMDFMKLLAQFALLGLIERGDHSREGVRVTRLGKLAIRSVLPA